MQKDSSALYKAIGTKLRSARRTADITQSELAMIVGLTRTSIANIEAGQQALPIACLYRICEALHIELVSIMPSLAEAALSPNTSLDTTMIDSRISKTEAYLARLQRRRDTLKAREAAR